jgi:hypothetical protein
VGRLWKAAQAAANIDQDKGKGPGENPQASEQPTSTNQPEAKPDVKPPVFQIPARAELTDEDMYDF